MKDMPEMWERLMKMLMIDMLHSEMTANDSYMLDEIDEVFKGKAVNGSGVCIDFEEINKAETMGSALEDIGEFESNIVKRRELEESLDD